MRLIEAKDRHGFGSEKGFMQRAKAAKDKYEELRSKITPGVEKAVYTTQQAALGAMRTRLAGQELGFQIGGATGKEKGTMAGAIGGGVAGATAALMTSGSAIKSTLGTSASKVGELAKSAQNPVVKDALAKGARYLTSIAAKPRGRLGVAGVLGTAVLGAGIGAKALGGLGEIKGGEIGQQKLGTAGTILGGAAGAAGLGGSVSRVAAAAAQGAKEGREKGRKRGFKLGGTVGGGLGFAAAKLLKTGTTTEILKTGQKVTKGGFGSRAGAALIGAGLGAQIVSSILAKRHAQRQAKQAAANAALGGFSPDVAAALQRKVESAYKSAKVKTKQTQASIALLRKQFGI